MCVYSASDIKLYGVSIAVLGAVFITFFVSYRRGIVRGMATGLALGALYSPILAPAFLMCALCGGAFLKYSSALACFASFFSALGWGFYVKGLGILDGFFAGVLSACLLYSVFHKLYLQKGKTARDKTREREKIVSCRALGEAELDGVRLLRMNRRMSAISEGLQSFSESFENIKMRFPKQ